MSMVTAIVLNWNGREDTLVCLRSLAAQVEPVAVVLVDNGSTDGSVEAVRREFREVTVLETGRNLGYAGGNNVGLRHALAGGSNYLFVLNNDTWLAPDCVLRLRSELAAFPDFVAAAPKSLQGASPDRIHFAGGRIARSGISYHVGLGEPDGPAHDVAGETEWITGCALFASREGFERVGLFDERYFLLFEDLDWCMRARRLGWRLRYVPGARLWHAGSQSFGGKRAATYQYYSTRNGLLWIERSFPPWRRPLLSAGWLREAWSRAGRLGATPETLRSLRSATRRGVRDYLARRFGPGPTFAGDEAAPRPRVAARSGPR